MVELYHNRNLSLRSNSKLFPLNVSGNENHFNFKDIFFSTEKRMNILFDKQNKFFNINKIKSRSVYMQFVHNFKYYLFKPNGLLIRKIYWIEKLYKLGLLRFKWNSRKKKKIPILENFNSLPRYQNISHRKMRNQLHITLKSGQELITSTINSSCKKSKINSTFVTAFPSFDKDQTSSTEFPDNQKIMNQIHKCVKDKKQISFFSKFQNKIRLIKQDNSMDQKSPKHPYYPWHYPSSYNSKLSMRIQKKKIFLNLNNISNESVRTNEKIFKLLIKQAPPREVLINSLIKKSKLEYPVVSAIKSKEQVKDMELFLGMKQGTQNEKYLKTYLNKIKENSPSDYYRAVMLFSDDISKISPSCSLKFADTIYSQYKKKVPFKELASVTFSEYKSKKGSQSIQDAMKFIM